MTFCLGIKCKDGLVAIADTRITSGSEVSTAKKIAVHQGERHAMFVLTSGLRSVRDKAITYFEERWRQNGTQLSRSYEAVNALAGEIRRVYEEDNDWLVKAGLHFDLHCIVGSQLAEDDAPHLYLLYPQGNWVEVSRGTPYLIIGETRFGKPILDRALRYDASLEQALRLGVLSFNSTEAAPPTARRSMPWCTPPIRSASASLQRRGTGAGGDSTPRRTGGGPHRSGDPRASRFNAEERPRRRSRNSGSAQPHAHRERERSGRKLAVIGRSPSH